MKMNFFLWNREQFKAKSLIPNHDEYIQPERKWWEEKEDEKKTRIFWIQNYSEACWMFTITRSRAREIAESTKCGFYLWLLFNICWMWFAVVSNNGVATNDIFIFVPFAVSFFSFISIFFFHSFIGNEIEKEMEMVAYAIESFGTRI